MYILSVLKFDIYNLHIAQTVKKPNFDPDKLFQRALVLHNEGKLVEAESLYKTLVNFFPREPNLISALGTLLLQRGLHSEGVHQLKTSLSINPNQPQTLYNLGIELQKYAKFEDALQYYNKSIELNPANPICFLNKGNTLKELKKYIEALENYDEAIRLSPNLASAHWNKSLTQLLNGEFSEGWKLYEWGWEAGERGVKREFSQPKWLGGNSINGKTILIIAEQGLGDYIQFCRYIPMLVEIGAKVIIECSANLKPLFSTIKSEFQLIEEGEPLPNFDTYCPVMSLPLAFKTTLENIPNQTPYLFVDQEKRDKWRKILGEKKRPRVGIAWSGSLTNKIDLNLATRRNIPLESLKEILSMEVDFHVLQKEFRSEDAKLIPKIENLNCHQNQLNDFSDTAALICEMDIMISTCTSIAHLSGALNHPTIVLLPFSADYRWMETRTDSPWYPSIQLIRQTAIGNWKTEILQLEEILREKFSI